MKKVKTLIIRFKNEIAEREVEWFRGAVGVTNRNVYTYPVVQYKRIKGKAAIICVGEGEKQNRILQFVQKCPQEIRLGRRVFILEVESVEEREMEVGVLDYNIDYALKHWLPLDQENLLRYNTMVGDDEERAFLESRILKGNLHTLVEQFGIDSGRIDCKILKLKRLKSAIFKKQRFLRFDCVFRTNLVIPDFIGIGQKPSFGYGTVTKDDGALINAYKPKKLFLLGGRDLEMKTIKEIVRSQRGCAVIDRNLRWDNAVLSAYNDVFDSFPDADIYAVELREDIPIDDKWKSRYRLIDHHNDNARLPSALEQVAAILGVDLSRMQKLIAANDSGYIPAMKALMASDDEIADIRRRDRAAQGVSEEDERLAEQSITENMAKSDELIVVKSLTSKFSPVCDRLFPYKRLLIYTDSEWVFYGERKEELVQQYADALQQGKLYHGGGENGFVGSAKDAYTRNEIEQFVESIKDRYGYL